MNEKNPLRLMAACLICAAMVLATSCSKSEPPKADCANPETSTSVSIADSTFAPGCIAATPDATLTVTNSDSDAHTFTVEGTKIDVNIDGGESASVALSALTAGTYTVICRYHSNMVQGLLIG